MEIDLTRRAALVGATAIAASAVGFGAVAASSAPPYTSAIALRNALAGRKVSALELVDAAISRIEALDPKINAVSLLAAGALMHFVRCASDTGRFGPGVALNCRDCASHFEYGCILGVPPLIVPPETRAMSGRRAPSLLVALREVGT